MIKSNWILFVLIVAILLLGFFQFRSCSDHTADKLQVDKTVLAKKNDSLLSVVAEIFRRDALLRQDYELDTTIYKFKIDSLTKREQNARIQSATLEKELEQTISDLKDAVMGSSSGSDTGLLRQMETLKKQFSDYVNQNEFGNQVNDATSTYYNGHIAYLDSVISEKNKTIDSLKVNYYAEADVVKKLMADLDQAIAQLKKGKRTNILRTIGEAVLVILLIAKK